MSNCSAKIGDDEFYRSHLHLPGVFSGVGEYHNYPLMSSIYVNKTGFYATISGMSEQKQEDLEKAGCGPVPVAIIELIRFIKGRKIHLLDCHSASAASTALSASILGTPIVQTFHYDFKTDFIHKYLCRHGNNNIITVSQWIADKLTTLKFVDRQMISVIPTGIDLDRFNPEVT